VRLQLDLSADHSLARFHDASRRRTGQLVGFTELGGELLTIRTGRPAHNVELVMIADMASQFVPAPVVSHRSSTVKKPRS
jgi:hypothetical protein